MSSFKNATPWVAVAQQHVAGEAMKQENIQLIDEYKDFTFITGDFSHAKPKIQPDSEDKDKTDILSFSHSAYNIRTAADIDAANYYASTEVGAKMKSREAIYKEFKIDFEEGGEASCQDINKVAYELVLQRLNGSNGLGRFDKYGQAIEFINDTMMTAGPTWVNTPIKTENTTDAYQVSSLALISPPDFIVPVAAGMLYCKLISPARIAEWMLVDGLKKNLYWAPYQPTEDEASMADAPFTQ